MDCPICIEPFNKTKVIDVKCQKCEYSACRICVRRYILSQGKTAHCMNCKTEWSRSFIVENLSKTWVYKEYRQHQDELVLGTEKARLGEDMENASEIKHLPKYVEELAALKEERAEIQREINAMEHKVYRCRRILKGQDVKDVQKKKRDFIFCCPVENCNGMLSTQWRCKICETYVCSGCREIKGVVPKGIKPTHAFPDHICNADTVKTVELLKKDTKNCPKCGVLIYKLSGCDQMWCVKCHIAFSWNTGTIVTTGVVHNPHYYQYIQENGADAVRAPQDVPCGGLPNYYQFRTCLRRWACEPKEKAEKAARKKLEAQLYMIHQRAQHIQHVDIVSLRETINANNPNRDLRIRYIISQISDIQLKKTLSRRTLAREKKRDLLHILELFNTVLTENMRNVFAHPDQAEATIANCHRIRQYSNKELKKLSVLYNQNVRLVAPTFHFRSAKYTKKSLNAEETGAVAVYLE